VQFACRVLETNLESELRGVTDDWVAWDWHLTPEADAQAVVDLCREQGTDIAVIDHYHADIDYQTVLYNSDVPWMQFDGRARHPVLANWVLNTSPNARESDYASLKWREDTQLLLGPAYALLRREFREARSLVIFRDVVQRILLTFGGGDDRDAIILCLKALVPLAQTVERTVLTSNTNPHLPKIKDWIDENRDSKTALVVDSRDVAAQMARADLAIIAGGTTTFEVAGLGLPALIIQTADNQASQATEWERTGALKNMGPLDSLSAKGVEHQVMELLNDPRRRKSMSTAGKAIVDCLGAQRVAETLLSSIPS
jgi:spore coat polysaccharide biosynthesis predicted glycosyltransferase SpsG